MDKLNEIYDSKTFIDLYADLNVDENASSSQIKKSYLKLVKTHHPDQGGNEDSFRRITRAYEILSNSNCRKQYDSYYIKKNINNDEIFRLKNDFKKHITDNTKKISKDEAKNIFDSEFNKNVDKDTALSNTELNNRINDLELERNDLELENNDIRHIIKDNNISINDIYNYNMSINNQQNQNTDLQLTPYDSYNSFPYAGTMCMYSSLVDDSHGDSNMYSFIDKTDNILDPKNIDFNKIKSWKASNSNINNNKLTDQEFKNFKNNRVDYYKK